MVRELATLATLLVSFPLDSIGSSKVAVLYTALAFILVARFLDQQAHNYTDWRFIRFIGIKGQNEVIDGGSVLPAIAAKLASS